jgi:hypothetical protein
MPIGECENNAGVEIEEKLKKSDQVCCSTSRNALVTGFWGMVWFDVVKLVVITCRCCRHCSSFKRLKKRKQEKKKAEAVYQRGIN